jgi:hypothetical protein
MPVIRIFGTTTMFIVGLLLLQGCMRPKFDLNKKILVLRNGKAFEIPTGVRGWVVTNQFAAEGTGCKFGYFAWRQDRIFDDPSYMDKYNAQQMKDMGLSGCVKPLTNEEYQAKLTQ